ncbi:hypothetical protein [Pseudolysinimonas sp.]|uniref:hypothetical protein n=1 Tax=Pseudolysinimonas sp. TaxID=2680009 RepID=UPI003F7FA847
MTLALFGPVAVEGVDLDLADDRMYCDLMVKRAFRDGKVWTLMLDPVRVDRTLELIRRTKASIEEQLGFANRTQGGGEPLWRKRTVHLLGTVNTYLADAKDVVKRLDEEEELPAMRAERDRWMEVAGLLVDLFHEHPALDLIVLPVNNMTASQWAAARTESIEQKAAA